LKKYSIVLLAVAMSLTVAGICRSGPGMSNMALADSVPEPAISVSGNSTDGMTRSITQLCAHKEPLVSRELIFDEEGELIEVNKYTYDEYNRYSSVKNYSHDTKTGMWDLRLWENYSYDDYFYYVETRRPGSDTKKSTFDLHGNAILVQYFDNDGRCYDACTHSYRYPVDEKYNQEEMCYDGEKYAFSHRTIKQFNEAGDVTCNIVQYENAMDSEVSGYKYDDEGRMIYKGTRYEYENLWADDYAAVRISYSYDENGNLKMEHDRTTEHIGRDCESNYEIVITYDYDSEGRLIQKTSRAVSVEHNIPQNQYLTDKFFDKTTRYTVVYEY